MASPHLLSYTIQDDAGAKSHVNVFLSHLLTVANIQAFSDTLVPHLDLVTGGQIVSASVALAIDLPGTEKQAPLADHAVQKGALFGYNATGTVYRWSQFIPAIRETLVTGGAIDVGAQACLDLISDMVDGSGGIEPTDRYENDLAGSLGAELRFRKA
jgi:hypothetical protein